MVLFACLGYQKQRLQKVRLGKTVYIVGYRPVAKAEKGFPMAEASGVFGAYNAEKLGCFSPRVWGKNYRKRAILQIPRTPVAGAKINKVRCLF